MNETENLGKQREPDEKQNHLRFALIDCDVKGHGMKIGMDDRGRCFVSYIQRPNDNTETSIDIHRVFMFCAFVPDKPRNYHQDMLPRKINCSRRLSAIFTEFPNIVSPIKRTRTYI